MAKALRSIVPSALLVCSLVSCAANDGSTDETFLLIRQPVHDPAPLRFIAYQGDRASAVRQLAIDSVDLRIGYPDWNEWSFFAFEIAPAMRVSVQFAAFDGRAQSNAPFFAASDVVAEPTARYVIAIRGSSRPDELPGVFEIIRVNGDVAIPIARTLLVGTRCPPPIADGSLDWFNGTWFRVESPKEPPTDLSWVPHPLGDSTAARTAERTLYQWSWNGPSSVLVSGRTLPKHIKSWCNFGGLMNRELSAPVQNWAGAVLGLSLRLTVDNG